MSAVRVKFGDVVSNLNETVRHGEEHSLTRVVGLEHIEPQDPDLRRWDELSDLPDGTSFTRIFRRGQVLFGKRRAYQRKVAVAPFDGICSSDILVFAPANKKLHPDFLLFIVQSEGFFSHALQTSSGSLSPRTRWQDLATFEFELPSIEEQQRIVELLSGVDAHAEALRFQLHVAKETRKAVLHHLLTAGGVDWVDSTLGNVAKVVGGGTPRTSEPSYWNGEVVWLTPGELTAVDGKRIASSNRKITEQGLNNSAAKLLPKGTVLLTTRASIGLTAIADCSIATNQGFQSLVPKDDVVSEFLLLLAQSKRDELISRASGTIFLEISANAVKLVPVLLPPLKEQQRIVDEISKIDAVIQETTSALAATRQLRSALLNKEIS